MKYTTAKLSVPVKQLPRFIQLANLSSKSYVCSDMYLFVSSNFGGMGIKIVSIRQALTFKNFRLRWSTYCRNSQSNAIQRGFFGSKSGGQCHK